MTPCECVVCPSWFVLQELHKHGYDMEVSEHDMLCIAEPLSLSLSLSIRTPLNCGHLRKQDTFVCHKHHLFT